MGHYIQNKRTYWTDHNGKFGLMTVASIETKKICRETHKVYFKALDGTTYCSDLLDYNYLSGYSMLSEREVEKMNATSGFYYFIDCDRKCSAWADGVMRNSIISYDEILSIRLYMRCTEEREDIDYLLDKCSKNGIKGNVDLYNIIRVWLEHPEMEMLVGCGNWQLGLNKSFWRLSDKKKKEVCAWLRNHDKGYTLGYILDELNGKDHELREVSVRYKVPYGVTQEYYDSLDSYGRYYLQDYYRMARALKKNLKDKYWLMPKDLKKAHDKLMEEHKRVEEAQMIEARKGVNKKIKKLVSDLQKYNFEKDGYSVFIAPNIEEIIRQANVLNQCLITAGYDKKMAEGTCILVFVRKEEKPVATMEITFNKYARINQFYADEHDRDNCKPTKEVKELGQIWFDKYTQKAA